MGRHYEVRWHAKTESWRSDCGDLYLDKQGRQRRKTVTFRYPDGAKIPRSDKPAAMAALAARVDALKPRSIGGFTYRQVAEHFLYRLEQRVKANEMAEKTSQEYALMLGYAGQSFGKDTPANQITAAHLHSLVQQWKDQGKKPTTINFLITAVCSCFSWASRPITNRGQDAAGNKLPDQLITSHPFAKFPRLPVPQTPPKYADRKEIAHFLRWAWNRYNPARVQGPFAVGESTRLRHGPPRSDGPDDRRYRQFILMVRTILWTGCRPSEICRSRWEWVDWKAGTITIPPTQWKNGRKTGRSRRIYLPPAILRAIRRIHDGPDRHAEVIFAHRFGSSTRRCGEPSIQPWTAKYLGDRIYELRRRAIAAGVPLKDKGDNRFHLYRLRHTRASDGLMQGLDAATVAEVLGTSANQIARTYGHLTDQHTASAAMKMTGRRKSEA